MMKRFLLPAILTGAFSVSGCSHSVLERNDIIGFGAEFVADANGGGTLSVRGLVAHSALQTRRLQVTAQADELDVLITLQLAGKDGNGNFNYAIPISATTNKVFLGQTRALIWERKP